MDLVYPTGDPLSDNIIGILHVEAFFMTPHWSVAKYSAPLQIFWQPFFDLGYALMVSATRLLKRSKSAKAKITANP
jgi:hypothetical protein